MRRRALAAVAVVVLVGVLFVGGRYYGFVWPSRGPLGDLSGTAFAGGRTQPGGVAVLMFQLPDERLKAPIELRSAELVGAHSALEHVGMSLVPCARPVSDDCTFGIVGEQWPLPFENHPVSGYRLAAGGNPNIAVALRLPERTGTYRVRGLVLDYSQGWRRFRTEIGPDVKIHAQ